MDEYTILKTNADDYDKLVLCLSSESLLTYSQLLMLVVQKFVYQMMLL